MVCTKDNGKESDLLTEVTPLVNFLVNNTVDAAELELLQQEFASTITPQLTNLTKARSDIVFKDGLKSGSG